MGRRSSSNTHVVNVKDFGATGNGSTNDTTKVQEACDALTVGDTLYFPPGRYAVDDTIEIDTERVKLVMDGYLIPHGSFSDYLLLLTRVIPSVIADYAGGISAESIRLDGMWQSRGLKVFRQDEGCFQDVLIIRPYGTACKLEGVRESAFYSLRIVSGLYREAFSAPPAWSAVTAYNVGDRVRINYSDWSGGSTYAAADMVKGSDGVAYRSLVGSNIGNDPITDNVNWVWEPWLDFQAAIASTNKDPMTNNTNDGTSGDRYWKRVYRHEAALDMNQEEFVGDGTNSVEFFGTKIRNSDYETLVRADLNTDDNLVRSIHFNGGHLHAIEQNYLDAEVAASQDSGAEIRDFGHVVDIGRARRVIFSAVDFRTGNTIERMVGVDMTSDVKGWEQLFYVRIMFFPFLYRKSRSQ